MLKHDEKAVSPVIAVILMVAITVVLSAVVYVWVSDFGSGSESPRSLSLQGSGKNETHAFYTVTSATAGLEWADLQFNMDGQEAEPLLEFVGEVLAGQSVSIPYTSTGQTLTVIDVPANSVILTLKIR